MDSSLLERARRKKRVTWAIFLVILFSALFAAWLFYWFVFGRYETKTEDAYVGGNIFAVTASVSATALNVYADRSDLVEDGQLLVDLDVSEVAVRLSRAEAQLAQAVREAVQLREKVNAAAETLRLREVEQAQAALLFAHRKNLQLSGAIPQEEITQAQTNLEVAVQRTRIAAALLEQVEARIEGTSIFTDPEVLVMKANYIESFLDYQDGQITSPVRGYVAQREVQAGDDINKGETVMTIVPLDDVWVTANFKETKIENLSIGQPVTLYSSAYGKKVKYKGEVYGAVPGTGVSFSLLPPQNATGNWIKIVQRVPVLIKLCEPPPEKYPLLLGLSMSVHVDTKKRGESLMPVSNAVRSVSSTPQDDHNIRLGAERADAIIRANIYE
ncbi:MAG: efflux RND transporter periplasmic adaptor subunit [Chlamydiales bacterium]|nr:efflux RND transporter periplasmic adaptor subunit [Chlamydiales bacterium]